MSFLRRQESTITKKYNLEKWIPACAGMTEERMGMIKKQVQQNFKMFKD